MPPPGGSDSDDEGETIAMMETGTKKIRFMATSEPRRTSAMRSETSSQAGRSEATMMQLPLFCPSKTNTFAKTAWKVAIWAS